MIAAAEAEPDVTRVVLLAAGVLHDAPTLAGGSLRVKASPTTERVS